jgi:hypothetical protein
VIVSDKIASDSFTILLCKKLPTKDKEECPNEVAKSKDD